MAHANACPRSRTEEHDLWILEHDRLVTELNLADKVLSMFSRSDLSPHHVREAQRLVQSSGQWGDLLEKVWSLIIRHHSRNFILLTGRRGTGKTTLATAVGLGVLLTGGSVRYCQAAEMLRRIRATYSRGWNEPSVRDVFREHATASLLILDEVHDKPVGEHDGKMFAAVLDQRYREGRPTVLIGNQVPGEMVKTLGASVADRFAEVGTLFELDWTSFRNGNPPLCRVG